MPLLVVLLVVVLLVVPLVEFDVEVLEDVVEFPQSLGHELAVSLLLHFPSPQNKPFDPLVVELLVVVDVVPLVELDVEVLVELDVELLVVDPVEPEVDVELLETAGLHPLSQESLSEYI